MSTDDAFSPQRHATRAPVDLPVRLDVEESGETITGRCNNISIGGMFIVTDARRPPGEQVRFELDVGDGSVLRGLAELVWHQAGDARRPAGLGFKFRSLEQQDRKLIFKLVSEHIKERLASRVPPPPPKPPGGETPALLTPQFDQAGPPAFAVAVTEAPGDALLEPEKAFSFEPVDAGPETSSTPPPSPPSSAGASFEPPPAEASFESPPAGASFDSPPPTPTPTPIPTPTPAPAPAATSSLLDDDGGPAWDHQADGSSSDGGPSLLDEPAGSESGYADYLGADRFAHRPAPRRGRPVLVAGAVVAALLAAAVYFFGDIFVEWTGVAPIADGGAPTGAAGRAEDSGDTDGPRVLEDVSFRRAGDALEVTITTSGPLSGEDHDSFRLGGESPREVVQVFGVERTEAGVLKVGHAGVEAIRTGWHDDGPLGPRVHLVMDLDDRRSTITGVRIDGRRLLVRIEKR